MKNKLLLFAIALSASATTLDAQTASWQGMHHTPYATVKENFNLPPIEFANHVIYGWQGPMEKKNIKLDFDTLAGKGFRALIIEAGYNLPYEYLSPEWFKAIRGGVEEAKKHDMKVWLIDEGKYPSGFAGGKFSKERPDLRMQGLVTCGTIPVKAGETLKSYAVDEHAISAVATSDTKPNRTVVIKDHKIDFEAGDSDWNIVLVRSDFRTGPTRAVNNPTGGKDTTNSLCDYLNPVAMRQFLEWTHEQYKKYLGNEFGKTIYGFRGDEPDYSYTPWTPAIIETFKQQKGYDPTPYLASMFTQNMSEFEKRFKADYWDVWSKMFAENFFKLQADWCEQNGVAYITHLNSDHNMPSCVRVSGDMMLDLSRVQIPGVDAIWNQIWPGTVNDFPKFASSVAHLYGKPRVFSESFAAYFTSPSIPQAKYVVDYQVVRGINFFEFMYWASGTGGTTWMAQDGMKELNEYTNRITYLMAQGVPGARIAMYMPTSTYWLGNQSADNTVMSLTQTLLKHQRDFDFVNDEAFSEALTIGDGYMENKAGQRYYTLILPGVDVISQSAWSKIEEFVARGGKLLVWGKRPDFLVGKTFTSMELFPDFTDAAFEPSASWSSTVERVLPAAEMAIVKKPQMGMPPRGRMMPEQPQATDSVRYMRKVLPDADLYFLFNEGSVAAEFEADFDGVGEVEEWNAQSGEVKSLPAVQQSDGKTRLSLNLQPWESRIITIKKNNYAASAKR